MVKSVADPTPLRKWLGAGLQGSDNWYSYAHAGEDNVRVVSLFFLYLGTSMNSELRCQKLVFIKGYRPKEGRVVVER